MNLSQSILICSSKYGDFEGRASRSEFWWFYLFGFLYQYGVNCFFNSYINYEEVYISLIYYLLISLLIIIPTIAVAVRRFHDIGRSGWSHFWSLTIIGMIPVLVWLCAEGSEESNQYGDPIYQKISS